MLLWGALVNRIAAARFDADAGVDDASSATYPSPSPDPIALLTRRLMVRGGDERIVIDPETGANKYGCGVRPDPGLVAFGSSTASVISRPALSAAERLHASLIDRVRRDGASAVYAAELDRVRQELGALCGLEGSGAEVVIAPSGTDAHLYAALMARDAGGPSPLVIGVEPAETGGGAPAALALRHFSKRSALASGQPAGELIDVALACEAVAVPVRDEDGRPRIPEDVDAVVMARATAAVLQGRRVLLVLADATKTGLVSPSVDCALALQRGFPGAVEVLVDACQFRLSPATLRAYVAHGFWVAITGSKFLTGPSFSGALLVPPGAAARLKTRPVPDALRGYAAKADWPQGWSAAQSLDDQSNFGLLLRWEAALEELRRFRRLDEAAFAGFARTFGAAVMDRIERDPRLESLAGRPLDRGALSAGDRWDAHPTIFPFLLCAGGAGPARWLGPDEARRVYLLLREDLGGWARTVGVADREGVAGLRVQLGQPVTCRAPDGAPSAALRLCLDARLASEALGDPSGAAGVLERAQTALAKASWLAGLVRSGRAPHPAFAAARSMASKASNTLRI